ncbi:CocE/NonD family hydrolase [Aspergillus fijiensis CBS 313.89]|uniref:Alpha/beta-hydrolase n=1 Tax=Aspergillus fijiensis CBS 313.89 TaxID=1448319 RepID=A0A8G1RQ40_9EURO|nr:alpha/beta-hydrolase [Aspergillus fijiensis CBS 313.89]RAK76708.1 alpha/beta-hydrolase [Aspergillus fijiensis CBS 313.89]
MASTRSKYQTTTSDVEGYTRSKHTYIPMRDGVELCANLFLPFAASKEGKQAPVICSMGPYGKDIHASTFGLPKTPIYAEMYKHIKPLGPDAAFELCEPTIWCREYGYALLRVDVRGVGGSQGKLDPFGLERSEKIQADAEGQDLYDVVEWAADQPWCTGKVAFSGISYFGMVGYWASMQRPPHLACVMSYESACSMYQAARRGGIYSNNFQSHWYHNIVVPYQGGRQDGTLTEEQLAANRVDYPKLLTLTEYPTDGAWAVLEKVRKLSDIEVPFYSAGNWTDPELHLPGNIRAFNGISSQYKWLEMHTGNHLGAFYEPDHIALQKKFLDHFLFDKKANGMLDVPRIRLLQHHGTETLYRENEVSFPPADAEDVSFYLTPEKKLSLALPSGSKETFAYAGFKESLKFSLESPFSESFELLGSPYLELEVSTQAKDLDLFVYLRAVDADGNVIVLRGNHGEPMDTFARGYFRLSHRDEVAKDFLKEKVLAQKSMARSEVTQGKVYSVLVPLYPAAFLFDPNQRLELEIGSVNTPSTIPPMRHEGGDRLPDRFECENVIFSHGKLVLPRVRQ